ncbi:MAG: hypothetical protein P8Z38_00970 [Robiginitalea sp.]
MKLTNRQSHRIRGNCLRVDFSGNHILEVNTEDGAGMILNAITGMIIPMGRNGFSKRGWKLMVVGLIFPLLFLFVL